MAPKKVDKKSEKGQQKALEKQKQKIAEDKTFGLKNKNKSKAVQKVIKQVHQQVKGNNVSEQVLRQREQQQKEEKKREAQRQALLTALTKGTENIKKIVIDENSKTTPASIKAGQQIDLYTDQRDARERETMENWDLEKLQEVIASKHGSSEPQAKGTDIVCKHFLDALEKKLYGWFWTCPNGGSTCKYRHCLPPGYVLKPKTAAIVPSEEEDPLEEKLERQRAQLKGEGTKVTLETFKAWKERKEQERRDAVEAERLASEKKHGGKGLDVLSGRDLFTYDPTLFVDDAAAADEDDYQEDEAYWETVLNENQRAVDAANEAAKGDYIDNPESQSSVEAELTEKLETQLVLDKAE